MNKKSIKITKIPDNDPEVLAEMANLIYVNNNMAGFTRKLKGKNFSFFDLSGKVIKDVNEIKRIRALAIPPAYVDVWICPLINGHLQATGKDAKGRKQYRYHPQWRKVSDETKFEKMIAFGEALPLIRKQVDQDLSRPGLPKQKILALIVNLLEKTLIRVGNEEYVKQNNSFGLTTFLNKYVEIQGSTLQFKFKGKSGQSHQIALNDKRLSKIVKRCKELPGQSLFEYLNEEQQPETITSTDVNDYLYDICKQRFTAKDFRTWAGTVFAIHALQYFEAFDNEMQGKKNIVAAVESVSKKLGNTPSVCRKSYIHPEVLNAYLEGTLLELMSDSIEEAMHVTDLSCEEEHILNFLKKSLK